MSKAVCDHGVFLRDYCDFCDGGAKPLQFVTKLTPKQAEGVRKLTTSGSEHIALAQASQQESVELEKKLVQILLPYKQNKQTLRDTIKAITALHETQIRYVIGRTSRYLEGGEYRRGQVDLRAEQRQRWQERRNG